MPSLVYTPSFQGYKDDKAEVAQAAGEESGEEDQNSSAANAAKIDALESKVSGLEAQVAMLFTNF